MFTPWGYAAGRN